MTRAAYVEKLPCRPDGRPGGVALRLAGTGEGICRWPDAAACAALVRMMRQRVAACRIEWDGELYHLPDAQWQDLFQWARECVAASAEAAEA